jgi:hypothetical protein
MRTHAIPACGRTTDSRIESEIYGYNRGRCTRVCTLQARFDVGQFEKKGEEKP